MGYYSLKQGELLVVDFEWKFTALSSIVPKNQLCEEEKFQMFEERFLPR